MMCVYQIGTVPFGMVIPDGINIEKEEPFSFFSSREKTNIQYLYKESLPAMPEDALLLYQDVRNLVYECDGMVYRYIGDFTGQDWKKESHSCVVWMKRRTNQFEVYVRGNSDRWSERMLFNAMGLEHMLLLYGHVILHSSYILHEGEGIMFTAPSQTGKSTQADLWKTYVAKTEIINGDRSVLHIENKKVCVSGLPFCGSSQIAYNKSGRVKAIVVLRQGKENVIRLLPEMEAFRYLYGECSVPVWDPDCVKQLMDVLQTVVSQVPIYYLVCRKEKAAVDLLYETIQRRKQNESDTNGTRISD